MSKVIYLCSKNKSFDLIDENRIINICKELEPDNISSKVPHRVSIKDRVAFGIMNHGSSVLIKGNSLLLGHRYDHRVGWEVPLSDFPDGSYGLFRENDDYLEVVSDPSASRTLWYYFDDSLFISSTSQRAIVMFLGGFVFDKRIIPWMLSTGSLGPALSWDMRIRRLGPDSSVILDKTSWSISINQKPIIFTEKQRTDTEHQRILTEAIRKTVKSLNEIDFNEWVLPLSGGYDSRAIICFLIENRMPAKDLKTITWGLKESINQKGNDAKVAKKLADTIGVPHKYYHTNISSEPIEKVIDRFLLCGEGRVDHLSGYMDGLEIWSKLYEDGVKGIIRGDEGFGWSSVTSELTVKESVGCMQCSDYSNLTNVISDFGLSAQKLPDELEIREDESLEQWRDRLYHSYRLPTILAALSDIKFSFVEQINPLLSGFILNRARELPDRLRTDKALFKKIVNTIGPNIEYAKFGANADPKDILRNSEAVDLFKRKIGSEYARILLSHDLVDYILNSIRMENSGSTPSAGSLKYHIKRLVPRFAKNWIKDNVSQPRLDGNVLAFRVFIIIRMHQILSDDCNLIKN